MDGTVPSFQNIPNVSKIVSFDVLPKILIFQLKRTQFDPERREAFKTNTPFKFPSELYMDRFLSANVDVFQKIRQQSAAVKVGMLFLFI